jgi:hypothetical protein
VEEEVIACRSEDWRILLDGNLWFGIDVNMVCFLTM